LHNLKGGVNRPTDARTGTRRFSLYEIYWQFSLNYDRISAVVGLIVLVAAASTRSVPSLPSLIVICLFTAVIPPFDFTDHQTSRKRRK
jgi:high-affinity nickel permease